MLPPQMLATDVVLDGPPRIGAPVRVHVELDDIYPFDPDIGIGARHVYYAGRIVEASPEGFRARLRPADRAPEAFALDLDAMLTEREGLLSVRRLASCGAPPRLPPEIGRMTFESKELHVHLLMVGELAQTALASIAADLEWMPRAYFPNDPSPSDNRPLAHYLKVSGCDLGPVTAKLHFHAPPPGLVGLAADAWRPLLDGLIVAGSAVVPAACCDLPQQQVQARTSMTELAALEKAAVKRAFAALRS